MQHLIKPRIALFFHESTQLHSHLRLQSLLICEIYRKKKSLLLVRVHDFTHWKIISFYYSFKEFYIHYFSVQGQPIPPVGQANVSLLSVTFSTTLLLSVTRSFLEECENMNYHRTLLVSYHKPNTLLLTTSSYCLFSVYTALPIKQLSLS